MEIKTLAKNTATLASPKVIKFAMGIVRAKFIAIYLGPVGAGIIDQLQDIISRTNTISLAGLDHGVVKLVAESNSEGVDASKVASIIKGYLLMVVPIVLMVTAAGYIFADEMTLYVFGDLQYKLYFQIGFSALPITILTTTSFSILKSFKKVKSLAMAQIAIILINFGFFVPLIYFFKTTGGVVYVTLSFFVMFLVYRTVSYRDVLKVYDITVKRILNSQVSKKIFKELSAFLGVGLIGGTFYIFTEVTSRSIVVNNLGIDQLGIYSPILRWARLFVGFILPAVYTYLYPRLSEVKNDVEIVGIVNDVIRLITFITFPFIILGIATRDWIIPIFYSKDFLDASVYLPYHFSMLLFTVWSSILGQIFWPTGRLKEQLFFGLIINSLSLFLVYMLVPEYGLYGFLVKFTLIPLLSSIMYFAFWSRRINFKLKTENIKVIVYCLISVFAVMLIKDVKYFLQILALATILASVFLLKEDEKKFLLKKLATFKNKLRKKK